MSPSRFETAIAKFDDSIQKAQTLLHAVEVDEAPKSLSVDKSLDDLMRTYRQQRLLWYLKAFGIIGIAYCLYEIALEEDENDIESRGMHVKRLNNIENHQSSRRQSKRRKLNRENCARAEYVDIPESDIDSEVDGDAMPLLRGHVAWQAIVNDYRKGEASTTLYYLASMPIQLIRALINGDLPLMMRNGNCDFVDQVGPYVQVKDRPGVYAVFVAVTKYDAMHSGYGLTLRQLMQVVDTVRQYCNLEDQTSGEIAQKIDVLYNGAIPSSQLDYGGQRRYGCGSASNNFKPHLDWVEVIERTFLNVARSLHDTQRSSLLDQPMRRCFTYIGLSKNVLERSNDHSTQRTVSPLIGLLTAVLRYHYQEKFDTREYTYQVLHTSKFDDVGLDEMIITLLASGHWWDGGLNKSHAGVHHGSDRITKAQESMLQKNAKFNHETGHQRKNVEDACAKVNLVDAWLNGDRHGNFPNAEITTEQINHLIQQLEDDKKDIELLEALEDFQGLTAAISKLNLAPKKG